MANGRISLSVYDANGGVGNFLTHLTGITDASLVSDITAALATVVTAFNTVSDAGIREATFSLVSTAGARAPQADASIPSGAVFDFSNVADPTIYGLWVPSFKDTLLGPGRAIDISGGASAAFVASLIAAVLGGKFANGHYVANAAGTKAFRSPRKL